MDIGLPELLIVLLVVGILFGPGRLTKLGRELGEGLRAIRQGLDRPGEEQTDGDEKEEE